MTRRLWILLTLIGAGIALVVAYLYAPGPVNSTSLGYSVAVEVGAGALLANETPRCEELGGEGDRWSCEVEDPSGSGGSTTYEVEMKRWGWKGWKGWTCWDAMRTGPRLAAEKAFPDSAEGCVRLRDYLRIGRRLLD